MKARGYFGDNMNIINVEEALESLEKLIAVQKDACTSTSMNDSQDQYMRGMYNGLIVAKSVLDNKEPKYLDENLKISAGLPNK